ncbi:MAG TPA: FG-GAP-like repeat-containing protein [Planctomycetota bacterium]|nr:FG-GAP-like repeat-containing protein [Planctomycetota bacterium]
MTVRVWTCLLAVFLGLAPLAPAQRFGFTHQMPPAESDLTQAVAVGDVDGDGDLDAFVGNGGQQSRLYLNDGTGVFTDVTATNLPALLDNTTAVALGDVDGDGDLDAFVGNGFQQNRLYLNGGTGVFTDVTATNLPSPIQGTRAVALGDVDGDGDLDAFGGNASGQGQQDRLFLNGGAGVFTDVTATNLPALPDETRAVALGDVDGDGDLDAFVGNGVFFPASKNRLYLNGGTGVFTDVTATNLPALLDDTRAVALGDMDGDGDLDVFVGNYQQQNRLDLNVGTGVFTDVTATNLPGLLGNTQAVTLGDVDGDGDLDAFIGNTGPFLGGQNRLYLNEGTGVFTDVTATNLPGLVDVTWAVALGDVDGDGDLDAFVGNYVQQNRLYLNGGTGIFTDVTVTSLPALMNATRAVALGDVDGDGDLDAFVGNYGQQNRLFLNGGAGVFADLTASNLPALSDATNAIALGDVDGDGDLDAFVGNEFQQNRLYLNGGTGVLADVTATSLPALMNATRAVALGDVDGDGDLDAFVGHGGFIPASQNRLYVNGGTGVFTDVTATNLPALLDETRAVALADVDGDGDLDVFVGNYMQQSRLYLDAGTGAFTDVTATSLPAVLDNTFAVALGDVDGDGDLDAFVGNGGTAWAQNRIYTNLTRQVAWRGIPRAGKFLTLDLWGSANGSWLLAASAGSADIPLPPFGSLRLFPPTLFIVAGGTIDPQGSASLTFLVPANPALVGLSLYWQAVVGPPLRFTNLEITPVTNL